MAAPPAIGEAGVPPANATKPMFSGPDGRFAEDDAASSITTDRRRHSSGIEAHWASLRELVQPTYHWIDFEPCTHAEVQQHAFVFLRHQVKRFYVQEYLAKLGHAARLKREPPKMEDSSWLELEDNEAILQRKVKHLESEIASLTIKLDEANANLSSSDEQLKQTMSTIERLKSHFSGSSRHSDELEARAQAAELKLAEMEAAKNDQQVLVVETASKAKSSKVPDKLVTDLKAKITMLEQENIALRKNSSTQIPAISSSVPSGPSSEQLAKLQDQLGKLEAENSLLTQKLTILMTQQISVAPQAATQVAPDPATEELLKKVTRELDQAHGTETELRRRISDLESRLTSLTLASQSSPDKNTRDPMMEETLKKVDKRRKQKVENDAKKKVGTHKKPEQKKP